MVLSFRCELQHSTFAMQNKEYFCHKFIYLLVLRKVRDHSIEIIITITYLPYPKPCTQCTGSIEGFKWYRQWTHVFRILREIDLLYEYYGHFQHVIDKTKNIGGTVLVC